jgi:mRNA interferase MazF
MAEPAQGEVWWANLDQPTGRRPVLVLTRDSILRRLTNVTHAPLTRTIRKIPSEVILTPADGVPHPCAVSLDNIGTVPKARLDRRITRLSRERMIEVWEAIRFAFDMPR